MSDILARPRAATPLDLDAYCARIGYRGERAPTLAALRALNALHPASIPFEAIDVLLGRGIDLSPAAIDAKILVRGRGGYCFEQNGLFRRALEGFGFAIESLAGRVRWMRGPDAPVMPRTHMVLKVNVAGEDWLADVGFGGCVPTAPLRLAERGAQPTDHENFRVVMHDDGRATVEAQRGDWLPLYDLMFDPQYEADYEVANWFTSTHAGSPFKLNLIIARTTPEARYTLLDNRLTIRTADGRSEQRMLDADGIERTLAETFGLPVALDWWPVIERAVR